MFKKSLDDWMRENKVYTIKAFSETDACDLPNGWEKPAEFTLNAIVVYGGGQQLVFTDEIYSVKVKGKYVEIMTLDAFTDWCQGLEPESVVVGYGSKNFDIPLIESVYPLAFINRKGDLLFHDLLELVQDMTAKHYDSYPRRISLAALASMNKIRDFIIPLPSVLTSTIQLLSMWRSKNKSGVLKNLLAEAHTVARLTWQMDIDDGSLLIRDERTDKRVRLTTDDFSIRSGKVSDA